MSYFNGYRYNDNHGESSSFCDKTVQQADGDFVIKRTQLITYVFKF